MINHLPRCRRSVFWFDTGTRHRCTQPRHHPLPHSDGLWLFDDLGFRVDGTELEYSRELVKV